jgi:uncharacterized Zn-finger protein
MINAKTKGVNIMVNNSKEKIYTEDKHVSCNGLEVPYDHPTIYLEIDQSAGQVECPYCSRVFVLKQK